MSMWKPSPPQGFTGEQGQVIIGRSPIPLFAAPQGIDGIGIGPQFLMGMAYEPDNWADAAYLQRIPLTINGGQVPSPQTNFVLLINSTFGDLAGQSVGSIRIGTENFTLDYEIQEFDPSDGKLIAWAKVPSIDIADVFYVYFDNVAAPDNQNPSAVWDVNYNAVWHMNQTIDAVDSIKDSTINAQHLTPVNTPTLGATGKIGKAAVVNGTTQFFNRTLPKLPVGDNSYTLSAWVSDGSGNSGIMGWGNYSVINQSNAIRYRAGTNLVNFWFGNDLDVSIPLTAGFHYVVAKYDAVSGFRQLSFDGILVGSDSPGALDVLDTSNFAVGLTLFTQFFDGTLDDVRVSDVARSANMILTEFNNQNAPDTFYSTGAVEDVPTAVDIMAYELDWFDANFLQRFPLTINSGQVPSTQNDFPLLIDGIFPELFNQTIAQLRFAGPDNIQLEYEIQDFDPIFGRLIAWVKKPTVSNGDIVYVYFDNLAAVDEQNPPAVYDSNYKGVYHFSQATGDDILDSTINGNDGEADVGAPPMSVPAKIGNGLSCASADRKASFPNVLGNDYTVSIWGKIPASDNESGSGAFNGNQIINADVSGDADDYIPMAVLNNHMSTFVGDSAGMIMTLEGNVVVNTDIFIHIVITRSTTPPGTLQIYINGILDNSLSPTFINNTLLDAPFIVFGDGPGISVGTDGIYDEMRFSDIVRSADRILTEFNNQNDQSIFYTKGAVETFPPTNIAMRYEEE